VVLADLVDLHDMRVLQTRDGLGFGAEALEIGRAGVAAAEDHLEGHQPPQGGVVGFVDDTHAAPAEFGNDFIARRRARHRNVRARLDLGRSLRARKSSLRGQRCRLRRGRSCRAGLCCARA
jgi:hypothetical protein